MHQLIYVSEARQGLRADDLFRIVEQSARNNPSADLTGFLIYRNGRFLQLLEGPLMSIETLLAQLSADDRHRSLEVVGRLPITERSFPRWRMRRIGDDEDALAALEHALVTEGRGRALPEVVRDFLRETIDA